jgi:hypothetical protein
MRSAQTMRAAADIAKETDSQASVYTRSSLCFPGGRAMAQRSMSVRARSDFSPSI